MATTNNVHLMRELHVIRAHHLHYSSLLDDYAKHVDFIRDMQSPIWERFSKADQDYVAGIMARECKNLSTRLKGKLDIQEKRLKNSMDFVCLRRNGDPSIN